MTEDLFRHLRAHAGHDPFDHQTQWWKKQKGEMNSLDARQQLLVILMEECGELIQECSKNLRRGELFERQDFKKEVGDVYAMIELLVEWDVLSWTEIEERVKTKRQKLSQWSDLVDTDEGVEFEVKTEEDYVKQFGGWRGSVTGK